MVIFYHTTTSILQSKYEQERLSKRDANVHE